MVQRTEDISFEHMKQGGIQIQQAIEHFHRTYHQPISRMTSWPPPERVALKMSLIFEEYTELSAAIEEDDMVATADALGDLIYVIFGMAVELGIPLGYVLREIQKSNMSKLDTDGLPIYRDDGKVLKGPNFQEPDIEFILREVGRWAR